MTAPPVRSLLVTGGAGFIGTHFVHFWCARYPADRVVVLDALTYAGDRARLAGLEARGAITFVHGDICDADLLRTLFPAHDITHVVHFAAESHVDRSIASPDAFVRTNVLGTQSLLDAARARWCHEGSWRPGVRFHQVSTDEVFGPLAPGAAPFTESSPYNPSSPYSASKAAADHLVRAAGRTYGLPFSITYAANNFGAHQYPEKLIPLMVCRALRGEPLPLYGDGQQSREWLHVHEHNTMLAQVLLDAEATGETYNLGGHAEWQNVEVVRRLCAHLDARFAADPALGVRYPDCPAAHGRPCWSLVTHVTDRPGHDRRYALDTSRFTARFGPPSPVSFEERLAETVDWYIAHA